MMTLDYREPSFQEVTEAELELYLTGEHPPIPWRRDANCHKIHDEMYPSDATGVREAKTICFGTSPIVTHDGQLEPHPCPVRHLCAAYAITTHEPFGIWGGLSERERRRIQRAHDWQADDRAIRKAQSEGDRQAVTALAKSARPGAQGSGQRRIRLSWSGDALPGEDAE